MSALGVMPLAKRVMMRSVRRCDHIVTGKHVAYRDRDRLLPDCDMQKSREVTGAKTLLDLLLKTADQKHLPEESKERLVREPRRLLKVRQCARHRTRRRLLELNRRHRPQQPS